MSPWGPWGGISTVPSVQAESIWWHQGTPPQPGASSAGTHKASALGTHSCHSWSCHRLWNPQQELIQEICYCGKGSFHQAVGEIIKTFIQPPLISKYRIIVLQHRKFMNQFSRSKKQNQVTPSQVTQCSFQAIWLRTKSSPDGQKTTIDKLDPFMCPFNKIHLHSYLTTLFKSKGEQLPHAKHSLHSRVPTTVPTRDTQAGEGQGGV